MRLAAALPVAALLLGCDAPSPPAAAPDESAPPSEPAPHVESSATPVRVASGLDRAAFNRGAMRLNLPLYWAADANGDGTISPEELAVLAFYPESDLPWKVDGAFGPRFFVEFDRVAAEAGIDAKGDGRDQVLRRELDEGAAVLVRTDLRRASREEREVTRHVLAAARHVDELYALQTGAAALRAKLPPEPWARSVFRRSWGPACSTPALAAHPACTAVEGARKARVGVYPEKLQDAPTFCKDLEARPDAKALLAPFVAVQEKDGKLVAVPYHEAWPEPMRAVAKELRAAAAVLGGDEGPMRAYLEAAATAFETNDWGPADEAWAKMNARNSKYYLRVAPDEVYWDPCRQKAGFHVSYGRINKASLELQDKLTPHRQAMEDDLAKRIGPPYRARPVTFSLPDFMDVIANAGDSRPAVGITIGQSLPNWGPVQKEGRGRTVAMVNLYGDPDSVRVRREKAASLLGPETMKLYPADLRPGQLSTVLHEATHNLGPTHEWPTAGKKDTEVFGGDLASVLEELKAQTGALYLLEYLGARGVLGEAEVRAAHVDSLVWALNHVSRGMKDADGRKPYGELAAIQVGVLLEEGALRWDPKAKAANGRDEGAFELDFAKLRPAVEKMMAVVGAIKAKGDKAGALALEAKYADTSRVVPHEIIRERCRRFPQPSFVFSVEL